MTTSLACKVRHVVATMLLVGLDGCAASTGLRLGQPLGYAAYDAKGVGLCATEILDVARNDLLSGNQEFPRGELHLDEDIDLPAGRHRLAVRECYKGMGPQGPVFRFELNAEVGHRYEICISDYLNSMGGPEGPSYAAEIQVRDATTNRIVVIVHPAPDYEPDMGR
jgi:hypothetical protein